MRENFILPQSLSEINIHKMILYITNVITKISKKLISLVEHDDQKIDHKDFCKALFYKENNGMKPYIFLIRGCFYFNSVGIYMILKSLLYYFFKSHGGSVF